MGNKEIRGDIAGASHGDPGGYFMESSSGMYVKYSAHKRVVDEKDTRIAELEAELDRASSLTLKAAFKYNDLVDETIALRAKLAKFEGAVKVRMSANQLVIKANKADLTALHDKLPNGNFIAHILPDEGGEGVDKG